jgi:type II secretory pathway predicted ATPase ExeA
MNDEQLRFFGFWQTPFQSITDPRELFQASSLAAVINGIAGDITDGNRIIGVRGVRGGGKTCFARLLAAELGVRHMVSVQLDGSRACPQAAQALLGRSAGLAGDMPDPSRLFAALQQKFRSGHIAVIVDDADLLAASMFRYLWQIAELCRLQAIKLHIVLIGDLGAWPGLNEAGLTAMRRATVSNHMIPALSGDEAEDYLDHRLRRAGRSLSDLFTHRAAVELIDQASCIPERLNELTETALVHGYGIRAKRINLRRLAAALSLAPSRRMLDRLMAMPPLPVAAGVATLIIAVGLGGLTIGSYLALPQQDAGGFAAAPAGAPVGAPAARMADAARAPVAAPAKPADDPPVGRGLVLIAAEGDNIANLYSRVYRGLEPPPYTEVVAANRWPIKKGSLVIFPEPPHGWGVR